MQLVAVGTPFPTTYTRLFTSLLWPMDRDVAVSCRIDYLPVARRTLLGRLFSVLQVYTGVVNRVHFRNAVLFVLGSIAAA
jgi:hypothetical protein